MSAYLVTCHSVLRNLLLHVSSLPAGNVPGHVCVDCRLYLLLLLYCFRAAQRQTGRFELDFRVSEIFWKMPLLVYHLNGAKVVVGSRLPVFSVPVPATHNTSDLRFF